MKNLILITGAARSGKSVFAEELSSAYKLPVYFFATMDNAKNDPELKLRIEKHKARRPSEWQTVEAGINLPQLILQLPQNPACILVDCLTLYVTSLMYSQKNIESSPYSAEQFIAEQIKRLISVFAQRQELNFVVVTNEVGWSIVPDNVMARAFRDFIGFANQALAKEAGEVYLLVLGLRTKLK